MPFITLLVGRQEASQSVKTSPTTTNSASPLLKDLVYPTQDDSGKISTSTSWWLGGVVVSASDL